MYLYIRFIIYLRKFQTIYLFLYLLPHFQDSH
jgi:hypothetical protein